jgi:NAD(P)-dependent dehydrogenase (short-subunit alcohol dehydrogenase family)
MSHLSHHNQRVVITAAASGIGLATAQAFVTAGARVFISDADAKALSTALLAHPEFGGCLCNVADEAQVQSMFGKALEHLGGLDILVNNAGIAGPTETVENMSLQSWRECLAVNLDGSFLCAREATRLLKAQRSGSIINLSSTAGLYGFPRRAPYAAAKWAIRGLTRTLAQELGPFGVRVNCICPGSVGGDRMDRVIAAEAAKIGKPEAEVRAHFEQAASLQVFVSAQDIANGIVFVTSPNGARISGQDIVIDGHTETL